MNRNKYKVGGIGSQVDAIYSDAIVPCDKDNKLIEALSYELVDAREILNQYSKSIPEYSSEQINLPVYQRRNLIKQLRTDFRFPLPVAFDLEHEFISSLNESYRVRGDGYTNINGEVLESTVAKSCSSNTGFVMISHSGCGKSTLINSLLSRHPQVYIHRNYSDDIDKKVQIAYIYVQTYANSNFTALLEEIGAQIDKALKTAKYEEMIKSSKGGIAGKTRTVAKLIEVFSIGAIIFDEIQNINFDSTKENSIENLLTLNNMTKVALIMVGTEDAYKKMPNKYRFKRRLGVELPVDRYCSDKKIIERILANLFKYQWVDQKIELNSSMVNVFYEETSGIIDQIVTLYMFVQDVWLKTGCKSKIDGEYVKKISREYFPGLKELLKKEETVEVMKQIEMVRNDAINKYEEELNSLNYNKNSKALLIASKEMDKEQKIKSVINKIKVFHDEYSDDVIADCTRGILSKNLEISDKELARSVLSSLENNEAKHKSTIKVTNKALAQNLNLETY